MDSEWIRNIARISMQAMEEKGLCNTCFGKVLSASPLQIQLDQKTILGSNQLFLPKGLTDHQVEMTIPGLGKTWVTLHQSLKAGEKVILIQAVGGQQFTVIDRYEGG